MTKNITVEPPAGKPLIQVLCPKPVNCILAIDPGLSCGWAVIRRVGGIVASGVWDLRGNRFEGAGMRFIRLSGLLNSVNNAVSPDMVAYEEVRRHQGVDAAHCYGGIIATIQGWCEENKIPYTGVPVQQAKKLATGKGNADKDAMRAAAIREWPELASLGDKFTHDEADARWIAVAAFRTQK